MPITVISVGSVDTAGAISVMIRWRHCGRQGDRMERPSYSSVSALSMARFQKRLAEKYDDADLALTGIKLERLAMEAIDAGRPFIQAPFAGRFGMAPALHRRVAQYLRLYAGEPGHDNVEVSERKATNHETSARVSESIAWKNAGKKSPSPATRERLLKRNLP
jgi:hypothetical protein